MSLHRRGSRQWIAALILCGLVPAITEAQSNSSVSMDLSPEIGDQQVTVRYGLGPNATVSVEIFGRGMTDVVGFSAQIDIDTDQVGFDSLSVGGLFPNGYSPGKEVDPRNPGTIRVAAASFGGSVSQSYGRLATAWFETTKEFTGTKIDIGAIDVLRDGRIRRLPEKHTLELFPPNPDFDGDRRVGVSDFLLFANLFGARRNDGRYAEAYDLDGNGSIGFGDFTIFMKAFGGPIITSVAKLQH